MRKAYRIVIRRMFTGCDYTVTIFLKSPSDALERASRYVPLKERNGLRLVSCEPLSDAETQALRERNKSL